MHRPPLQPRPSRVRKAALLLLSLVATSCVLHENKQMEIDFLGAKYRFYIYEKPSSQLAVELRGYCRSDAGTSRRQWAQCSLRFLHDEVEVPAVGSGDWAVFTGSDQWDDYGGAVDAVVASGFGTDSGGERYARSCLVGDHHGIP